MARGELMKRLLASYGREGEFRSVAEEIFREEEQKNNRVLARTLRRSLESTRSGAPATRSLAPLLPFPDGASEFVERIAGNADSNAGCSCQVVHPRTARPLGLVGLLALWGVNVWRRRAA